jgi:AAA15 family ATPase/GTPase
MPRETLPKTEDDGSVIDYLDEDPEIPTQRYCVISFLSPEKVIKQRTEFMNEKFIEWLDYDWKIKGMEHLMAFIAKKYTLKVEDLFKDMEEFTKVHVDEVKKTDVHEQYQVFLLKHEKDLESEFTEKVEFRTNVRGVKVRRTFANLEECQQYAKVLQRRYPKDSLYVGKVGCWLPWDPSEHLMPEVEYAEKELNEMMRKYKENEVNREIFFEEEKTLKIEAQKKENEARRKKALDDAKKDAGLVDADNLSDAISRPVHPTEGAIRDL